MYNTFEKYMNPKLVKLLKEAAINSFLNQIESNIEEASLLNTPPCYSTVCLPLNTQR